MCKKTLLLLVVGFLLNVHLFAQTRLGLHYTKEELAIWKQRVSSGPYENKGDEQRNSPGDWERIVKNANTFMDNPNADRFRNYYSGGGCVRRESNDPEEIGSNLRDAAFYYLITGDSRYASAVRNVLLAEASNSMLNFTNTGRWCPGGLQDTNPGFGISEWLTRLMYGCDYIKNTLSDSDRSKLNSWFLGAARYIQSNYDPDLEDLFVDRNSGNYSIAEQWVRLKEADASDGRLMYYGGPRARTISRHYNNRRAGLAAYVGIAGVFLNNAALKTSGKRFFKELIMFGIYPTGYYVDFLRGVKDNSPDQGYAYASLSGMYAVADAMARTGDTELYDWTTKSGTTSSTSGSGASSDGSTAKGLKMHIKAMLDLRNRVKAIYATTSSSNVNNSAYRVDGIDASRDNYSVWDIMYALPNIYYKDSYIRASYLRTANGAVSYPSSPQNWGPVPAWTAGNYPGVLLMFGQMEGKVWPYPSTRIPDDDDDDDDKPTPDPTPNPTPSPGGSLLREYWTNLSDSKEVEYIPVTKTPSGRGYITSFEGPTNWGEKYGTRIRGYVTAPASGDYTFWIAGNDHCELWLSTDSNPGNKEKIAWVDGYTGARDWDKYSSQRESGIRLEAGKKYYVEVLHKEGVKSDNVAVGWQLPNGDQERPIGGNRLSPFVVSSGGRTGELASAEEAQPAEEKLAIKVFPNPVEDRLTIDLGKESPGNVSVTIVDLLGRVYHQSDKSLESEDTGLELNLTNLGLSSGMYILKIQTDSQSGTARIMKR